MYFIYKYPMIHFGLKMGSKLFSNPPPLEIKWLTDRGNIETFKQQG